MSNPEKSMVGQYSVTTQRLSQLTDVSHFVNGEDLHVVEVVKDHNKKRNAVVSTQLLHEILENPSHIDKIVKKAKHTESVMLVNDDFLDNLTQYGRYKHNFLRQFSATPNSYDEGNMISNDYFNDVKNSNYHFVQYVENSHHKHIWQKGDGTIYMEPVILDSGYAEINDVTYFLDDLVEHLSHRDDIAFITHLGRWDKQDTTLLHCPLQGHEKGIGRVIYDIEHHLEEGDSDPAEKETISVVFYPKQEDIKKIVAWNEEIDGRTPENVKRKLFFLDRFIIRDMLGGQAFLQRPPEVEEDNLPKRKFKH